ncbi:glycosyltransferase family protein [Halalkalicoccus salilacus]|uniref:glycosyl transferase family 2 n=1 Tax=Halalkalicoccus salilacus TaxID=3117459 RepID=UPI00300EA113
MEYVQERIATLHDLTDPTPEAPTDRATVVVPMTDREYAGLAPERTLTALERVDPARVIVPLRTSEERVGAFADWLSEFDLRLTVLWCNAPAVERLLADHGLDGESGKGRDVWLGLGLAAERGEFVVVHDADARTYGPSHVPRLLAPLDGGFEFTKGYYARVEDGQLYGRLFRLFYEPLIAALSERHDEPILDYLGSFRYALAGEMAATDELARELRVEPAWGLEVGVLGDAFSAAGFSGTAQVDLGAHEHDHRAVSGSAGLAEMSRAVGGALFRVLADEGLTPDFERLPERYREVANRFLRGYAADAAFNGLAYDRENERAQVERYVEAIAPPGPDRRLPAWSDAPIEPDEVAAVSAGAIDS